MSVSSLFQQIPQFAADEQFKTLLNRDSVRIERIVSHGHASPADFWYDQSEGEWIVLVQGAARLTIAGESFELRPGDYVDLPPHTRHRVEWTTPDEPTVWLAVFYSEAIDTTPER
jgi:cupin 2 domain-containing protein